MTRRCRELGDNVRCWGGSWSTSSSIDVGEPTGRALVVRSTIARIGTTLLANPEIKISALVKVEERGRIIVLIVDVGSDFAVKLNDTIA